MVRLKPSHLPHRVTVENITGEGADGPVYGPAREVRAYVEGTTRVVVDRRAGSPTRGQEVVSSVWVVLLPSETVDPGAVLTVWKGTARERRTPVLDTTYLEYPGTPSHLELRAE